MLAVELDLNFNPKLKCCRFGDETAEVDITFLDLNEAGSLDLFFTFFVRKKNEAYSCRAYERNSQLPFYL